MKQEGISLRKWVPIIFVSILFYWGLFNYKIVGSLLGGLISIIFPFILGIFIALILNIPMRFFEIKIISRGKKISKLTRAISLLLSVLIISISIYFVVLLVVPKLLEVIKSLIDNIPYYKEQVNGIIKFLQEKFPNVDFITIQDKIMTSIDGLKNIAFDKMPLIVNSGFKIAKSVVGFITNLIIAIVFSIYLLLDKENIKYQANRVIKALFKRKHETIIKVEKLSIISFSNFVTAQVFEALILGSLCTIGLLLLGVPYAVPIGVLVGVTALIPIVGAFLGMFIGSILIVSVSPIHVLIFIVYLLLLQQVESNVIYPKVVGNKVGLPGILVLVAITIGGSLMGIIGMILAVPAASVIFSLIKEKLDDK